MVLGFGMLLVGASGVFGELQSSLNEIWNVATPSHPFFELLRERAISFVMVWVFYSAQVFLCGAEFTRVYTVHRGSRQFGDAAPQSD